MGKVVRPARIEGDVAYITLTKGYVAVIDVEDVPLVGCHNWNAHTKAGTDRVYAVRGFRQAGAEIKVRMHRVIMGEPEGLEVDHRDGNGLNNRKRGDAGNLRVATTAQNQCNQRRSSRNKSGYKGVSWNKKDKRWVAKIKHQRKAIYLGYFATPDAAAAAYAKASAELHGEFGRVA